MSIKLVSNYSNELFDTTITRLDSNKDNKIFSSILIKKHHQLETPINTLSCKDIIAIDNNSIFSNMKNTLISYSSFCKKLSERYVNNNNNSKISLRDFFDYFLCKQTIKQTTSNKDLKSLIAANKYFQKVFFIQANDEFSSKDKEILLQQLEISQQFPLSIF